MSAAEHRRRQRQARWRRARAALALGAAWACAPAPPPPSLPAAGPEPPVLWPGLGTPCPRIARIEVLKSERLLRARCEDGGLVELGVALGRKSRGPKRAAGDWRTPEGDYRISGPARPSRFHLFLPIDYPSRGDAERARGEGRISEADYRRIVAAHERGQPPPGDTPLGGELGLHGEGLRWRGDSAELDWTLGCVALPDADVAFLAERVAVGTPVSIRP